MKHLGIQDQKKTEKTLKHAQNKQKSMQKMKRQGIQDKKETEKTLKTEQNKQ